MSWISTNEEREVVFGWTDEFQCRERLELDFYALLALLGGEEKVGFSAANGLSWISTLLADRCPKCGGVLFQCRERLELDFYGGQIQHLAGCFMFQCRERLELDFYQAELMLGSAVSLRAFQCRERLELDFYEVPERIGRIAAKLVSVPRTA